MLETIREFARERLEAAGTLDATRRRHAEHFLGLAEAAEPYLTSDDQVPWLDRLDRDQAGWLFARLPFERLVRGYCTVRPATRAGVQPT